MKILLIDVVRTTLGETWPSVEHSIGLMYLAGALRSRFGSEVALRIETLVSRFDHDDEERLQVRGWLEAFEPDVVGIRCLSIGKDAIALVAETAKAWNETCFVLAGGPHATDAPEETLRSAPLECVAIGEGETTMTDLVERLEAEATFDDVPGLAFLRGGAFVRTSVRELLSDLDALPMPDHSLVSSAPFVNRYLSFSARFFRPHGNILTSRGCPFHCMYCHNLLGKRFRARSPESVFGEIRYLHETYGFDDFQVIDDIFNLDLVRAKTICRMIIDSGMDLTFAFPNGIRGDVMDEELLDLMAEAGTKFVAIAIETASPRLQRLIQKNLKLDRVAQTIEACAKRDLITRGYFMIGFPGETEAEARSTIDFAVDSNLCGATFFTVVYFPGTPLYELARNLGHFRDGAPDVRRDYVEVDDGPYDFSRERLAELKHDAIRRFAFTRKRLENAMRLLPAYYSPREIDVFLMAHVASADMTLDDIEDPWVRDLLHRHFVVYERFSIKSGFFL